jgi:integrase
MMALEGVYEDNDLVFPGTRGRILDPSVLTQIFKRLATKAGVPGLRLHDLRHSHAAGLVRANVHPTVIQQRLGHASVAFSLNTYGHVTAGLQEEAANAFSTLMKEALLKSL